MNSDYKLDVIAICCEFSEQLPKDIARDYCIRTNVEDYLNDHTTVIGKTEIGTIVYVQF